MAKAKVEQTYEVKITVEAEISAAKEAKPIQGWGDLPGWESVKPGWDGIQPGWDNLVEFALKKD